MTLAKAFAEQAESCQTLGSPFMARLMHLLVPLLGPGTKLGDYIRTWPGDISWRGDVVPLRLAGGLHYLILTGRARELAGVYPPTNANDADLSGALAQVLQNQSDFLTDWMQSPPQTNEVRRSAAILPGLAAIAKAHPRPMELLELGASAGLNLCADQFCLHASGITLGDPASGVQLRPDWTGAAPPDAQIEIARRAGVDLTPIDATDPDQLMRLLSFLWPDQPHRADLTRAAAQAVTGAGLSVDKGDAADWLDSRLRSRKPGRTCVVFHTIAFQYFPKASQDRIADMMERGGGQATAESPLAWLAMEADGTSPGAALTLRLWPGDLRLVLGRADFHGRWVDFRETGPI